MTRRWRTLLMLWLALCLPLQGLAAAGGLWCAKLGFHAPAWLTAPAGHAAHGMQDAHAAGTPDAPHMPAGSAALLPEAQAAHDCHRTEPPARGPVSTTATDAEGVSLGPVEDPAAGSPQAPAADEAGAAMSSLPVCAHCAGCHAGAALPSAGLPGVASLAEPAPTGWMTELHPAPWSGGLERPPRTRPA